MESPPRYTDDKVQPGTIEIKREPKTPRTENKLNLIDQSKRMRNSSMKDGPGVMNIATARENAQLATRGPICHTRQDSSLVTNTTQGSPRNTMMKEEIITRNLMTKIHL